MVGFAILSLPEIPRTNVLKNLALRELLNLAVLSLKAQMIVKLARVQINGSITGGPHYTFISIIPMDESSSQRVTFRLYTSFPDAPYDPDSDYPIRRRQRSRHWCYSSYRERCADTKKIVISTGNNEAPLTFYCCSDASEDWIGEIGDDKTAVRRLSKFLFSKTFRAQNVDVRMPVPHFVDCMLHDVLPNQKPFHKVSFHREGYVKPFEVEYLLGNVHAKEFDLEESPAYDEVVADSMYEYQWPLRYERVHFSNSPWLGFISISSMENHCKTVSVNNIRTPFAEDVNLFLKKWKNFERYFNLESLTWSCQTAMDDEYKKTMFEGIDKVVSPPPVRERFQPNRVGWDIQRSDGRWASVEADGNKFKFELRTDN